MNFKHLTKISSWCVFLISFLIFGITAQRTVGFWDSGEFIAATHKLQVSHSPGAPLYTLLSKVFTSFFPSSYMAFGANLFSALCGAFTVFFVFKIITYIASSLTLKVEDKNALYHSILCIGAGSIGAFSLVFSHSFWTASTTVEVYTLLTLITSSALWMMFLWKESNSIRWLFLITFILGLSLGVHYLGLLSIFPIVLIYCYKTYDSSSKRGLIGVLLAIFVYLFFYYFLFHGLINAITSIEIGFVNKLKLPFYSGLISSYTLIIGLLLFFILWGNKKGKKKLSNISMGLFLFIIGYSTYATVLIRSNEQIPISNDARDITKITSFVNYAQYRSEEKPLINGQYFSSPLDQKKPFKDGAPSYRMDKKKGQYVIENDGKLTVPNFDSQFNTFFPRMYSRSTINIQGYKDWANIKGKKIPYTINGETSSITQPTFFENMTFLFKYQLGWLNFRYLLWNFAGIQNTKKGSGGVINGNWASGINWFDKDRIGNQQLYPKSYLENKTRNTFYFIPLLLGLLGFIFLFIKNKKIAITTGFMFFMFGPAINIFNNSLPIDILVRERDYIYIGSFLVFAIWIGLGVIGLGSLIKAKSNSQAIIVVIVAAIAPFLMSYKGWDDHNRSNDFFAKKIAKYYLDSCPENSILITNGDNATFPLYYLQEVENYRTDVRIVNFDLLALDIYVNRLKFQINKSNPINTSIDYNNGSPRLANLTPLRKQTDPGKFYKLTNVIDYVTAPDKKSLYNQKELNTMPTDHFSIPNTIKNLSPQKAYEYGGQLIPEINWVYSKKFYSKSEIILLDLLNQNKFEKPMCFAINGNYKHYIGLSNHMVRRGFVNQLLPIQPIKDRGRNELNDTPFNFNFLMNEIDSSDFKDGNKELIEGLSIEIIRPLYFYLAADLEEKRELKKAKAVLDKCLEMIPNEKYPYDKYMFDIAKIYYRLGEQEKGREIVLAITKNIKQEILIYTSFKPKNIEISRKIVFSKMKILNIIYNEMDAIDPIGFEKISKDYLSLKDQYFSWVEIKLKN